MGTLILCVGKGAWFTCYALFFTRSIGLTTAQFGLGVTLAGLVGMIIGGPLGYLADRLGAREVLIWIAAVQGVAVLSFGVIHQFWVIILVTCVTIACERSVPGIRTALIAGLASGPDRIRSIAATNAMAQAGMVAGAVIGAVVLSVDSHAGYLVLILAYGTVNLVFAASLIKLPHVNSLKDRREKRAVLVLRDRPFLTITILNGVLALNWGMLDVGLPLWITTHTQAQPWVIGVVMGGNAAVLAVMMRRIARSGSTVAGAGRLGVWSGLALACACLVYATSYHESGPMVYLVLIAASAIAVVGEMLFIGSGVGLSVGLTPHEAHGEYQGVFSTGQLAATMLAPAVMTTLLVVLGPAGWLVLGAVFLLAGIGLPLAGRWALTSASRRTLVGAGSVTEN
ncbi:MFS transporter [Amycolatopsis sp., V23-08]|uniref:MFS transporter n=1 Tax=Amycolatopsis heterodermiae TaxID=3110235 RepID=A0ABU5R256_9PSEU|nr:MFS transporter [Amycolatopsis sp., V23-08]MEA5360287.1 MFS transporter [Amycolatopsis sp., V23-08]